jgi:hypothetical protein
VLGRGTIQLKMKQENQETAILIIENVIYAPDCPIRLISPQQLHRQSKAKGHEQSNFTTDKTQQHYFKGELSTYVTTTKKPKYQQLAA